jgi:uncharacterized protein (DUF1501 family)
MKIDRPISRRGFVKSLVETGTAAATLAALGRSRPLWATQAQYYRALLCIYLAGGHDGNNLLIPLDIQRQAHYRTARGALAMPPAGLAPTGFVAGGLPYALHPALTRLHSRYLDDRVALVLNTGNLIGPLDKSGLQQGAAAPANLFSHSDQWVTAQVGVPRIDGTGWGGRLLDAVNAGSTSGGAVSTSGICPFLVGKKGSGNAVPSGGVLSLAGLGIWPQSAAAARRQALLDTLATGGGSPLRLAANRAFADGIQLAEDLAEVSALTWATPFPQDHLGRQLETIANLIDLRRGQPGRQVFIATLGGFDTHSGQAFALGDLFGQLDAALDAFYEATLQMGIAGQVTSFTLSEFGRTLQSNGDGSDHAWGNHQVVLGGAVQGGLYGSLPDLGLGGDDDLNGRGVWIPTQSTEQLAATLGRWFGMDESELDLAFPSLGAFQVRDLGFFQA